MTEDTLSHDKKLEVEDHVEATLSDFEQHYPSLSESTKAERKKKKKQVNKVKSFNFNSAGMGICAQKGSSKGQSCLDRYIIVGSIAKYICDYQYFCSNFHRERSFVVVVVII